MIYSERPGKGVVFLRGIRGTGPALKLLVLGVGAYLFLAAALRITDFTQVKRTERGITALAPALVNRLVVVDPGHGGPDPGVVRDGVLEKDITLAVALRLARFLEQGGARVLLTRTEDRDLAGPGEGSRKRRDLEQRVALANENGADVFICIHVNSFQSPKEHGAQTFYQHGSPGGRELAQAIQTACRALLGNTNRQPKAGDYFTGRTTTMPAVVVEIGFLTNPREFKLLQDAAYQSKVAFAIYAGLVRYFAAQSGIVAPGHAGDRYLKDAGGGE
jgi:N-acetylmuramoyl-L-alanine amidase